LDGVWCELEFGMKKRECEGKGCQYQSGEGLLTSHFSAPLHLKRGDMAED